jgi:hypothetical protein
MLYDSVATLIKAVVGGEAGSRFQLCARDGLAVTEIDALHAGEPRTELVQDLIDVALTSTRDP